MQTLQKSSLINAKGIQSPLFSGHPTVFTLYTEKVQGFLNLGFPRTVVIFFNSLLHFISPCQLSSDLYPFTICVLAECPFYFLPDFVSYWHHSPADQWFLLYLPTVLGFITLVHSQTWILIDAAHAHCQLVIGWISMYSISLVNIQILKIFNIHEYSKYFPTNTLERLCIQSTPTPYINSKHADLY